MRCVSGGYASDTALRGRRRATIVAPWSTQVSAPVLAQSERQMNMPFKIHSAASSYAVGNTARIDTRTPRWVYVFGIIVIMALLFVTLHLTGGGLRGHLP